MREIKCAATIRKHGPEAKWEGQGDAVHQIRTVTLRLGDLSLHDLERLAMAGTGDEVVEVVFRLANRTLDEALAESERAIITPPAEQAGEILEAARQAVLNGPLYIVTGEWAPDTVADAEDGWTPLGRRLAPVDASATESPSAAATATPEGIPTMAPGRQDMAQAEYDDPHHAGSGGYVVPFAQDIAIGNHPPSAWDKAQVYDGFQVGERVHTINGDFGFVHDIDRNHLTERGQVRTMLLVRMEDGIGELKAFDSFDLQHEHETV